MENSHLQNVKSQLAGILADLKERRANPFKGSDLEALTDEIRVMRTTYRLPYKEIAAKLTALKIETDTKEVAAFCRFILKTEVRRRPRAKAPKVRA